MKNRNEIRRRMRILAIDNPEIQAVHELGEGSPGYIVSTMNREGKCDWERRQNAKRRVRLLEHSLAEIERELSLEPGYISVFPARSRNLDSIGECIYSRN